MKLTFKEISLIKSVLLFVNKEYTNISGIDIDILIKKLDNLQLEKK